MTAVATDQLLERDRELAAIDERLADAARGHGAFAHVEPPGWFEGVTQTGRALAAAGLQLPALAPEQALVLRLRADA